jgi:class 3 adenylate cyclase
MIGALPSCNAVAGRHIEKAVAQEALKVRVERRMAAIMAADVVAYSRLMGADEESTLASLHFSYSPPRPR